MTPIDPSAILLIVAAGVIFIAGYLAGRGLEQRPRRPSSPQPRRRTNRRSYR